jgi:hypothetical protein
MTNENKSKKNSTSCHLRAKNEQKCVQCPSLDSCRASAAAVLTAGVFFSLPQYSQRRSHAGVPQRSAAINGNVYQQVLTEELATNDTCHLLALCRGYM